jgi:drug/metabolite transporter (DMT)-like permease
VTNQHENTESRFLLFAGVLFGQLLAGGTFPVAKIALESFEPFTLAITRFVVASLALLLIVWSTGRLKRVQKGDWGKLAWLGFLAIPLNQLLFLYGLKFTTPGRSALYYGATPVFVFLLAIWYLKERPTWKKMAGILASFAGVAIILRAGRFDSEILFGDLLVILAVIAWAAYTICGKPLLRRYGALTMTAYALGIGTVMYLPLGIYFALSFDFSTVPVEGWLSLGYLAIMTSVVAYTLWYWALARMEASKLAIFQNLQPVIAALLSFFFVGESFGPSFFIGGALVIAGVLITQRG